jgi:hypothetical protein
MNPIRPDRRRTDSLAMARLLHRLCLWPGPEQRALRDLDRRVAAARLST